MIKSFNKFRADEKGVTLVEYGIALVLAIVVGGTALTNLGGAVEDQMDEGTTILENNGGGAAEGG